MLERRQYDKELREQDSDYDDNLKVFDESVQVDDKIMNTGVLLPAQEPRKDKGKAKANPDPSGDASSPVMMAHRAAKRQRPAMDPFVASGRFCTVSISLSSAHDPRTGFIGIGEEEQTSSSSHAPSLSKKSNSSHSTARNSSAVCHASDKASKKAKKKNKSKNVNIPST